VNVPHFFYFTDTQFSEADLARSLLFTISNDVGQVASLYAMMHKLNKVIQSTDNHCLLCYTKMKKYTLNVTLDLQSELHFF
jgi:pantothenate kinase